VDRASVSECRESPWDDGAVQRQRVFQLTAAVIMGASAAAATAAGFREQPTFWQLLLLVLALCLTAGGTLSTTAPSVLASSTNDRPMVGVADKKPCGSTKTAVLVSDGGGVMCVSS
jgi:hypothetical protein